MIFNRAYTLIIGFAFLGAPTVWSQTDTTQALKVMELEPIELYGSRLQIPFSEQNRDVVVLEAKLIKSLPVQSINELLGYVTGVDVRQRGPFGGQADISINGGTFEQTLILVNGVKIIDPQTGHNMANLPVSIDAIEKIEVLKGTAASIYGTNALNGVINIVTKQPNRTGVIVSLDAGSSFESDTSNQKLYGAIGATVSGSLAGEKSNHFISLNTLQTSGHRYNTAMNNMKLFYQSQIQLKSVNSLQVMGGFIYNDFGANGFYSAPGDVESNETLQTGLLSVSGRFKVNDNWRITPSVSYRYNHDDYIFIRQNPEVYHNLHTTHVLNAIVNNSIYTKIGTVGFGLEYRNEAINSNSLGVGTRDDYGLYTEFAFNKVKDLQINIGAYFNYNKYFDFQFLPSLDASYRLSNSWRVFTNIGTGTRNPTYTDWYYVGPSNIGNSDLTPENALNTEGGVKFNHKSWSASANYFFRKTTDIIDWVKEDLNDPWQPQNFEAIRMHGVTASINYTAWNEDSERKVGVVTGLSYTWLNPKIDDENQQYAYSAYALENLKHQLIARVNLSFLDNYNIMVAGRYEQRITNKAYFLIDAKLASKWKNFQINISMNNLANVRYIDAGAVPLPGRWFSLGLKWEFWKNK